MFKPPVVDPSRILLNAILQTVRWFVLPMMLVITSAGSAAPVTENLKNRAVGVTAVPQAGNRIYRIHVVFDPADERACGTWTATTGSAHPAGEGLNVLYGSPTPGFPFTSNTVLRSYTSGRDYATGDKCTRLCGVVAPAVITVMNGSTEVGFRLRWTLSDPTPALPNGPVIELEQEVVVVGPVDGTESVDNTVIRETHTIRNFGPGPFRFGLRKLWDWQIGGDDGPFFGSCDTPEQACDVSMNLTADGSLSGTFPSAYVINQAPAVTVCPGQAPRSGCNETPPYLIAGTVAPPAGAALSPPPTTPELLQFNHFFQLSSSCWLPDTLVNGALCGDKGVEGGDDTAVAYFYGLTPATAITLGVNEDRSFTQYVAAARNACPGIISTPPSTTDSCCPPWNSTKLEQMLVYQGSGGIAAPYTLRFQPTSAFVGQMQAYVDYLNTIDPAITSITIHFRVLDEGAGPTPTTGTPLGLDYFATWTAGGNGPTPLIDFFTLASEPFLVNRWYRIHTGIFLNDNHQFFPDRCAVNAIHTRLQIQNPALARERAVLQMQLEDGRIIERAMERRK